MLSAVLLCASIVACGGGGGDEVTIDTPLPARKVAASPSTSPLRDAAPGTPAMTSTSGSGGGADTIFASPARNSAQAAGASGATTIQYVLAADRTTSAAVYTADGRLVRTLWRAEARGAGSHFATWDQRTDAGDVAPAGRYEVRMLAHDVRYTWEGTVGNSSRESPPSMLHKSFQPPTSLAPDGSRLLYAVGYNEGQSAINGFELTDIQKNQSSVRHVDPFTSVAMLTTDAERLYWVNGAGVSKSTFVAAYDLRTGRRAAFPEGSPVCLNHRPDGVTCYREQEYGGVIDLRPQVAATGIAVQAGGGLLAVARGEEDTVLLFDKHSGRLLKTLQTPLADGRSNQLAMTRSGDLWVLGPQGATRFTDLDTEPRADAIVTGLARPLAVAVDASDEDAVWIADGGSSQQIKRFDRHGVLRAVIGREGGYRRDPSVTAKKFCFLQSRTSEQTALAVASDRTLWAVDTCNNRIVRVDERSGIRDAIAYVPATYVTAVDPGNPSRYFANFLEYRVDPSAPAGGPASWRLARNWLPVLPVELADDRSRNGGFGGFRLVRTLANGRTYATLEQSGQQSIVELTPSGVLRPAGQLPPRPPNGTQPRLLENGDVGYATDEGDVQTAWRLPLAGFDASGNPRWETRAVRLASAPRSAQAPYFRLGTFSGSAGPNFPVTQGGMVVFFDPSVVGNEGFHLGAVGLDQASWAWLGSPSGRLDGKGSFQTRAVDQSITYGGNAVMAEGNHIVYGFHGEFYRDMLNGKVGQANQFMHFHDSGLFIGQFGTPTTRATSPADPGMAGNALSPTLLKQGGDLLVVHNDESVHGGIHRWRIENLQSIVVLRGSIVLRADESAR